MKYFIFYTILLLVLSSCDSALSDIELSDPSVVHANFRVLKVFTPETVKSEDISASLNDKFGSSIELKEGNVFVNDIEMVYKGRLRDYESDIPINKETHYLFDVVLADGKSYETEITTPANYFGTVTVPGKITLSDDIAITWTDFNPEKDIQVTYISYRSDGTWVTHCNKIIKDYGNVILKNAEFDYDNFEVVDVRKTEIRLTRTVQKDSNRAFKGGTVRTDFLYIETVLLEE